jgi:hypothetical protein
MCIGLTQLGSQNLNFKVVHVRCINYSTDIFAFFSILNYPILASSYVYYFYFSSIEIIDIKSTPDCLAIIIIPHSTSNPNTSIRHPYFYKVYYEQHRIDHTREMVLAKRLYRTKNMTLSLGLFLMGILGCGKILKMCY